MAGKLMLGLLALIAVGVIAFMMMKKKEGLKDIYFTTPQYVGALEFTPDLESFKPTGASFTPRSKLLPGTEGMADFNMVTSGSPERMVDADFNMVTSNSPERMVDSDFNLVTSQNPERMGNDDFNKVVSKSVERMGGWLFSDYPDNAFYETYSGNPRKGKALGSGIRVYPRGHTYMPGMVPEGFVDLNPDKKITVCHYPPGNPNNPQTMEIAQSAWESHKAHGDTLGACGMVPPPPIGPEGGRLLPFNIDFDNEMALASKDTEGFGNSENWMSIESPYNDRMIEGTPQITPILNGAYQTIYVLSATTKDGRLIYSMYGPSKEFARKKWKYNFPGLPIPAIIQ